MDVSDIVTLISSVGFPIVCCLIMFYVLYKLNKSHSEEMTEITKSVEANTEVLASLKTLIEAYFNLQRGNTDKNE